MPRPNPLRTLQSEANLARRIAYEREARGWTYDGMAKRMADVGCPIQGSAIYKIEKGEPARRRISVDELVALAKVFEADVESLLVPMGVLMNRAATRLFERWAKAQDEIGRWTAEKDQCEESMRLHVAEHPGSLGALEVAIRSWVEAMGWPNLDEATEYTILRLRGLPKDSPEWQKHIARMLADDEAQRGITGGGL